MDHALPDSLKSDLGLSKTGTAQSTSAWNEEPHFLHLPTVPEIVPGAVNLDQTNLCCYCFTRRADHLIIDCREFLSSPIQVVDFCAYLFADLQNFAVIVFLMQYVLKVSFWLSSLLAWATLISFLQTQYPKKIRWSCLVMQGI